VERAAVRGGRVLDDLAVLGEDNAVPVTELAEKPRRALDVRKQERQHTNQMYVAARAAPTTMTGPVPSVVMAGPILHSLVDRLRADERLAAFAAALPTRARVSDPVTGSRTS
jgi:hypothetical protein